MAARQALDGCTFHGEFEFGVDDVDAWYAARAADGGGQLLHYACSAGHIPCRVAALSERRPPARHWPIFCNVAAPHLLGECFCTASDTHAEMADAAARRAIEARLERGLAQGAIGIGLAIAYTTAADHEEIYRLFELGARWGAPVFVHPRGR